MPRERTNVLGRRVAELASAARMGLSIDADGRIVVAARDVLKLVAFVELGIVAMANEAAIRVEQRVRRKGSRP